MAGAPDERPFERLFVGDTRIDALPGDARGFAYGDGLFETMRVHRGEVPWWAMHMPYLKTGGIFVPTPKRYFLGDEVFLLLTLLEEKDRLPVAGKVVWVTPPGAQGNRAAGIGVQFADSAEGEAVRHKIETILAGTLTADKPTHTM